MARYLIRVSYTPESWATVMQNPQMRREAARGVIEAAGGKLFSFDFAPGTEEVVVVVDFPSDAYGSAAAIATTSAGVLRTYTVTRLMSPEETIEVVEQASAITYPPPT